MAHPSPSLARTHSDSELLWLVGELWTGRLGGKPIWRHMSQSVVFLVAAMGCSILLPMALRDVFPNTTTTPAKAEGASSPLLLTTEAIVWQCLWACALYGAYHTTSFFGHYLADRAGCETSHNVVVAATRGMLLNEPSATHRNTLAAEIDSAANAAGQFTGMLVTGAGMALFGTVGYFVAVVSIDYRPAVVVVVVAATGKYASEKFRRWAADRQRSQGIGEHVKQQRRARVVGFIHGCARLWETVQLLGAHRQLNSTLRGCLDDEFQSADEVSFLVHSTTAVASCISNCLYVAIVGYLAWYRSRGGVSELDLIVLTFYMKSLQDHAVSLVSEWNRMRELAGKLDVLCSFIHPAANSDVEQFKPCPRTAGTLTGCTQPGAAAILSNVELSYVDPGSDRSMVASPTQPIVLRCPQFTFHMGECVVIIGGSGGGKTTLLKALSGLMAVRGGTIAVRNRPYLVEQVPTLLPELSIGDNLWLAKERPQVSSSPRNNAELESALRAVNMWDAVAKLPRGLDTVVGRASSSSSPSMDGGASWTALSVGQMQRLCVARSLLTSEEVVMFDEPTASLDKQNMVSVAAVIERLVCSQGKAVIVVTHAGTGWLEAVKSLGSNVRVALVEGGELHGPLSLSAAHGDSRYHKFLIDPVA